MRGRGRLTLLAGAAWLLATSASAFAQTPDRVYRLIVLGEGRAVAMTPSIVVPELAKMGFAQGRNLVVEAHAVDDPDTVEALAKDVVARKPDAIIAIGNLALVAARQATASIPVVVLGSDLVELGIAENLARPGANFTGIVILGVELNAKRLEVLHEAIPAARRIAVLFRPLHRVHELSRRAVDEVATRAGVEVQFFEAERREDYASVFGAVKAAGAQALAINADAQFGREGAILAGLAREHGLPTMCQWREMAEEGCFMSYGPSLPDLYRRLAVLAARILQGAAPGEMPIEQPTRFELVVNLRTAKALGVTPPPTLLARADEVIE